MIRILVFLALLFAVAAGFAWLADRPGDIALVWQGYEVRTSLMVAAISLAALFVALAVLAFLLTTILRAPRIFGDWMSGRRRDRGFRALSRGMVAVGSGDVKRAKRYSIESRKILGSEPMTLLLAAQSAQLSGDAPGARAAFEAMLDEPETKQLGLRGLFVEAERAGEQEAARHFAEEAHATAPSLAWAGNALFAYQAADADWRGALLTLGSNLQAKLVSRSEAHRLRAVLLTARGQSLEASEPDEARALALEAVKLAPGLVPAARLAARLLARNGDFRRASKILEAAWREAPHPEIAEAYLDVRPGDAAGDRLKRAEKLVTLRPNSAESRYALARGAIDARDYAAAREALAAINETERTERFCLLMAEMEEASEGDRGRAREWLSRALRAPRDPVWMADGYVFRAWAPVSPVSGRLDAFEWRVPTLALEGEDRPVLDLVPPPGTAPDEPPLLEIEPATPPTSRPFAKAEPAVSPAKPAPVPQVPAASAQEPVAAPPLPDDPGIDDGPAAVDRLRLQ
ncbi:heme biosynthesis protein HemY [Kaistia algarum]|uniref:heme biosynthesis protein HemY n=1 Tax=Kaistia algarum TaxID=2083279 RepID=UPI000CE82AEE|nr:heme biosynthesis HemY N-terminal domain-containing protein [Kaistia algarum]MCX5514138.1 heme biosynthesis protein HemY [Kaistia algarum]PPE77955.1 heme biosynthesis protein HemY [Kaistia algarum]